MASNRKLQGEIDRVLKQIGEHLQEQKVHSAPTPNLKEKYEGDLKKEIKKLQRFRDQIKSWAANSDIKNKKPLLDARKSIEQEMERFKVLEKETKTKAYSKEGLNGANSRARFRSGSDGEPLDPREDPTKRDTFQWLDELEEKLQEQLSEMEEKMEGIKATSKKKKTSAVTNDAIMEDLQHKMDRHGHHLEQVGIIKDRLEHDELQVALVEEIHDDLDYYLNSYTEADFQEDETVYDALELDKEIEREEEPHFDEDPNAPLQHAPAAAAAVEASEAMHVDATEEEEPEESPEVEAGSVASILKSAGARTPSKATPKAAAAIAAKPAASPATATPTAAVTSAGLVKGRSGSTSAAAAAGPTPVSQPLPSPSPVGKGGDTLASILAKKNAAAAPQASSPAQSPMAAPIAKQASAVAAPLRTPSATASPAPTLPTTSTTPGLAKPGGLPTIAPAQLGRLPPGVKAASMPPPGLSSQTPPPGLGTGITGPSAGSAAELSGLTATGGVAPQKDRSMVPDDYMLTLNLLEPSLRNLPDPLDTDRPKQYIPRNPYRTPSFFPSVPAPIFDDPLLFDKLSVDTLFFIFYFQQGTPHQYLAARELKKQSWRYHKNFLTWFQRHDDPKITTEEYEQGTYVYFDYESGWCSRVKADFTFEYRHLEVDLPDSFADSIAATPTAARTG